MDFNNCLDEIESALDDVKKAVNGEPVENLYPDEDESDELYLDAMGVYECIDHAIELLLKMQHEIIRTHVTALETQLQNKIAGG